MRRKWVARVYPWPILAVTAVLGGLYLTLAILYANPELSVPQYKVIGRVSIVSHIGPYWIPIFGLMGVTLLAGAALEKFLAACHALSTFSSAWYTAALFWGAIESSPNGTFLLPSFGVAVTLLHLVLGRVYLTLEVRHRQ